MKFDKIKIKIKPKLLICTLFIIVLIFLGFLNVYNNLTNKKYYTYSEVNNKYSEKIINTNTINQNVIPKTDSLIYYTIPYKSNNQILGNVNLKIVNSENEVIYNKQYQFSDIVTKEKLKFDLSNIKLHKSENYIFEFKFNLNNNLSISIDNNDNIKSEQILKFNSKNILLAFSLFIVISTIILVISIYFKNDIKIHKIYLVISLLVGLCNIILLPPFTAPDEARHFYRAYDISQGNIIIKEINNELNIPVAYLPKEISNLKNMGIEKNNSIYIEHSSPIIIESLLDEITNNITDEKSMFSLNATSATNPIAYLPQIIFIKIGMILTFSPLLILYMARLGNLLLWISTTYISIKFIPKFKLLFCVIAMMPEITLLASSCSTDSFLMSVVMSFIGYMFYLKYEKINLYTKKNIIIIILSSILLALIKLPYILILLLILTVDYKNRLGKKNILLTIVSIVIGLLFYKIWSLIGCDTAVKHGAVSEHVYFVIRNPIQFIQLIIFNLRDSLVPYIIQIFSGSAWNYSTNGLLAISYFMIFIIVGEKSSNLQVITNKIDKTIITLIVCILFASICFVSFSWQPVDFGSLWGIQGRYFIPLIPMMGILLTSNKAEYEEIAITPYISIYLVWTITSTIFTLIKCNFLM